MPGQSAGEASPAAPAPIVKLLGGYQKKKVVSGMAHITGSGIPGNVCRALPSKLDARIELSTWTPPAIFEFLQRHGSVETKEMFDVFNMGVGYTLIVRPTFADAVVRKLKRAGEQAWICGEVVRGTGEVQLV